MRTGVVENGNVPIADVAKDTIGVANDGKADKTLWPEARARLERQKAQIYAEIRDYPFPIPACDAQYNYLLEKRDLVNQALQKYSNRATK